MIITIYGIIIFHLVEWISAINSRRKENLRYGWDMLGFLRSATPTMHEDPIWPHTALKTEIMKSHKT